MTFPEPCIPAEEIGVSVRQPDKAQELAERGVRVRHGDFDGAASLTDSFEGATQVLLVSTDSTGEERLRRNQTAVDAAKASGAQRILYTSHVGARSDSPFAPAPGHFATEEMLRASGVPFTALRNGYYADSTLFLLGDAVTTGEVAAPQDGPVSWTTREDLAEATAVILTSPGFDEDIVNLTAAEAIDLNGVAAIASDVSGRPILRTVVPDDEFGAGMPPFAAHMVLGLYQAARRGDFATVDPMLPRLLGRQPIPLRDVLQRALAPAE